MPLYVLDDLANLIFIGAYWVKDILWLRLLSIVGSLVVIPYYLLQTEPLWTPMMWSCVFIGIHATRSWGIVKERRPVEFTGDEQLLYDKTFSTLSPQQFKRLLAIGEWQDLEPRVRAPFHRGSARLARSGRPRRAGGAQGRGHSLGHSRPGDLAGLSSLLERLGRVLRRHRDAARSCACVGPSGTWKSSPPPMRDLAAALRKIAGAAVSDKLIRLDRGQARRMGPRRAACTVCSDTRDSTS